MIFLRGFHETFAETIIRQSRTHKTVAETVIRFVKNSQKCTPWTKSYIVKKFIAYSIETTVQCLLYAINFWTMLSHVQGMKKCHRNRDMFVKNSQHVHRSLHTWVHKNVTEATLMVSRIPHKNVTKRAIVLFLAAPMKLGNRHSACASRTPPSQQRISGLIELTRAFCPTPPGYTGSGQCTQSRSQVGSTSSRT